MAGINVLRFISEPTAAAMTYATSSVCCSTGERDVLVYDFGGGSFAASLLTIDDGIFEVKATSGETSLGGQDFDNLLISHLITEFERRYSKNPSHDPRAMIWIRAACEQCKRTLSSAAQSTIFLDSFIKGIDFQIVITRTQFDTLIADFIIKTMKIVERVLDDSKISKSAVHELIMVGGSTRIPGMRKALEELFEGRKKVNQGVNPDEAAASGAAIQASILAGVDSERLHNYLLLDVAPFSLGIEVVAMSQSILEIEEAKRRISDLNARVEELVNGEDDKVVVREELAKKAGTVGGTSDC
jgi:heat shock 70kDa protein 1/2/6/8